MSLTVHKKSEPLKGQREADQVRQIGMSHGGKVTASLSGGHPIVSITCFGADPEGPQVRAMLRAIEFAIRGQFDRGRAFPGMTQFTAKTRFIAVMVRCVN